MMKKCPLCGCLPRNDLYKIGNTVCFFGTNFTTFFITFSTEMMAPKVKFATAEIRTFGQENHQIKLILFDHWKVNFVWERLQSIHVCSGVPWQQHEMTKCLIKMKERISE